MVTFQKGAHPNVIDYPLTQEQIDNLQPCRLVNPVVGDAHGLKFPEDVDMEVLTDEVERVRIQVQSGVYPYEYLEANYPFKSEWGKLGMDLPQCLKDEGLSVDDPQGLANVVHMDNPMQLPLAYHRAVLREGANIKEWTPDYIQFLETIPEMNFHIAKAQLKAFRKIWEIKYALGIPRPEEISEHGKMCTAYPEGSPNHPESGQGHGAGSTSGNKVIIDRMDLTHPQIKQGLDSAYLWGAFRDLAGVHNKHSLRISMIACGFEKYMKPEIVEMYKA